MPEKRSKLILIRTIAGLFVLFSGISMIMNYHYIMKSVADGLNKDSISANLLGKLLREHERASINILNSYASRPLFIEAVMKRDLPGVRYHMNDLNHNNGEMDLSFLTDDKGRLWANYPDFPEALGRDLSDRDWYKGVSRSWKPYISKVFQLIVKDRPLAVALTVPVKDWGGKVIGILGNSQRLSFLASMLSAIKSNPAASFSVIDSDGNILYSNMYLYMEKITEYPFYPAVLKAAEDKRSQVVVHSVKKLTDNRYLTIQPVENINWTIVIERLFSDSLITEFYNLIQINVILFLIFLVITVFVIYQNYLYEKNKILYEKEIILKEVHHRVKNNMNTILALLTLQAEAQEDTAVSGVLNNAAGSVQCMMLLYDKLYRSENSGVISLMEFLPQLTGEIVRLFPGAESVKITTQIDDIILGAELVSTLGIVINELVTNAMKYAYPGRNDMTITLTASKSGGRVRIVFQDDGPGLPEEITFENSSGFGMQLVHMLVQQINGSIAVERNNGTRFIIEFEA